MTVDLFAGLSVSDYPKSLDWYGKLFGGPPAFSPNDVESVWELADNRFVYIEHRPAHAGHGLLTVFVGDLDTVVAGITARGLEPVKRERYENGVRKITYVDPDGNEIGYGGGPDE